jgi:hypothetical protein
VPDEQFEAATRRPGEADHHRHHRKREAEAIAISASSTSGVPATIGYLMNTDYV